MDELKLPYWYDLHTHLRQDELLAPIVKSQVDMACAGVLAMPNTKPPVAKVLKSDALEYWSIEEYRDMIIAAGGDALDILITPLYLTKDTTPQMIEEGAKAGLLQACKYYPPHGTTGADFGQPITHYMENGVLQALADNGVTLCVHGEMHGLHPADYFDQDTNAEDQFYREYLPKVAEKFPALRIACEHVTTATAVEFVRNGGDHIAASITPQHLLYTVGDLLKGLQYHLYCLPLLKFNKDRAALRNAVLDPQNTKFYAGTDSAAHTVKATECGCAAGCFTGEIAPQLYAQAFEDAGADLFTETGQAAFQKFLCENGANFWNLPISKKEFSLIKQKSKVKKIVTPAGDITPLPVGLGQNIISWALYL